MSSIGSHPIPLRPALLISALLTLLPACVEGPQNGDFFFGPTQGKALSFSGKHTLPNEPFNIQVLKTPDDPLHNNPAVATNWVTIATGTSSNTPLYYNDPSPYYNWLKSATPVPNAGTLVRWPAGGIMRFRVLAQDGTTFLTFDQGRLECYGEHLNESWVEIGDNCKSVMPWSAAVSAEPTPASVATPPSYLDFPIGSATSSSEPETLAYYGEINAPATLEDFRTEYGFGSHLSNEVSATYFNVGDLATGREMNCKTKLQSGQTLVACYVSNYGDGVQNFGGNAQIALNNAVAGAESGVHAGAFATVAMVYAPPISNDNSVRFMVYDGAGNLAPEAQLDSTGHNKGIPQNCITCHGGASYDAASHKVLGASGGENGSRFLPFDLDAFAFSNVAGYTRADQQENFRKLNQMIANNSGASAATVELINGWYAAGSVDTPGTTANTGFVPANFDANDKEIKTYKEVVAPFCRTCHISQSGHSFNNAADFLALKGSIEFWACANTAGAPEVSHLMPNAEVTLKRFWASPARAFMAEYLNSRGSCRPNAP